MLARDFYFWLLWLPSGISHKLSPVENELRDLVTQESVVTRAGMTTVIKRFRDGTIAAVEWPMLVQTALELDKASEELLWHIHELAESERMECM